MSEYEGVSPTAIEILVLSRSVEALLNGLQAGTDVTSPPLLTTVDDLLTRINKLLKRL